MLRIRNLPLAVSFAVLTLVSAGIAIAQSGTRPSGTPPPNSQPDASSSKHAVAAQMPTVIALSFYADSCPGCKMLAPKLDEVMAASSTQPCLFVKLDQSDKGSHQAEYLLAALGMAELWKDNAGRTGFVLLVDTKSKKVVATLTPEQDIKAMKATVAAAAVKR